MKPKKGRQERRTHGSDADSDRVSLAPLDFETAVRAAMATGKPPKAKRAPKKQRGKK